MKIKKNQVLTHPQKKPIVFDHYFKEVPHANPTVLFCHGYKGFKDWGAWDLVARAFVEAGFDFVKFNFSHNGGTIEDPIDFPDLDAFARNNYSIELDDLDRMITHLGQPEVSLIGHSRGGGIVLIKAEEDTRINKVISWAGVSDFKARFQVGSPQFENWKATGIKYIENSRTKQQMPHYWQFYEDFEANEDRLTIERAVRAILIPQLIIHGDADPTVDVSEGERIHSWNPNSELEIISGANHVFGAMHPWSSDELPKHLEKVAGFTITFLR